MAWTTPPTFSDGSVLTAAQLNAALRDNLNETAPAKATTQGAYFVTTALNSIAQRVPVVSSIATAETTTSTTYTDLATVGPTVTTTTGPNALICITSGVSNNTAGGITKTGFDISGATTVAAQDVFSFGATSGVANNFYQGSLAMIFTGLTPGSNTFLMKYKTQAAGTAAFSSRRLSVIPF